MCPGRTSQVVGKEHSAEVRVECARGGGNVTSTGRCSDQYYFIFLFGEQRAASVVIGLCESGLSSAAKAS